jgi:excisionase family DNA binding protein
MAPKKPQDIRKDPPDRLVTRLEAAVWLGVSKQFLAALAMKNEGPKYKVIGKKAMYHLDDVKAWWQAQSYASTPVDAEPKKPKEPKAPKAPKVETVATVNPDPAAMMQILQQMMQAMQKK